MVISQEGKVNEKNKKSGHKGTVGVKKGTLYQALPMQFQKQGDNTVRV